MLFNSNDHYQIVLGTVLGNGHLIRNGSHHYLRIKHSKKHLAWLQTKAADLSDYASANPWYFYKNSVSWRTKTDKIFTQVYEQIYRDDKKEISMAFLDVLRAIALSVWYGDKGFLCGRGNRNAGLRTQKFGDAGNEVICQYFNEVGLPCNINKQKNSHVIVFTVEGTKILTEKILKRWLPNNRNFKISG